MAEEILIRETLPDKSPAKQGKNDVFVQSHNQQNPRDAKPSDFVILKSEDAATSDEMLDKQSDTPVVDTPGKSPFTKRSK